MGTPPDPILERERELRTLGDAAQAARAGSGRFVLIEGAAGSGKSALLAAVPTRGMRVLRAAGGEWERDYAFGAIRQLFARLPVGLFTGLAALAAAIVAVPPDTGLDPGFDVLDAVYWALAGLAAQGPVLVVLDDLHWVDDASLQAIGYLARRVADLPLLLVGALRVGEPHAPAVRLDGLRELAGANVLAPAPLSPAAVAALVRAERDDADDDECAAVHEASAGNPLYVRELLRAGVRGTGSPALARAGIRGAGPLALGRPGVDGDAGLRALGERVARRLARVDPAAPALAGAIAVLGDGQPLARAVELAGLVPATGQRIAHELTRMEILAGDDPPAFAHPVVGRSLCAALPTARRASLHASAATALEAAGASVDIVAGHLAALPPAGSEAVARRLLAAGMDARDRGESAVAIAWLRRALAEGAGPRAELLYRLGLADDRGSLGHLEEALALGDGPLRVKVAAQLSLRYGYAGMWEEGWGTLERVAADPGRELVPLRAAMMADDPQRVSGFEAMWDELERLAAGTSSTSRASAALLASEAAARGLGPDWVDPLITAAGTDDPQAGSWASLRMVTALVATDRLHEADAFAESLAAADRRTGATVAVLSGALARAWVTARRGDLAGAEAQFETLTVLAAEAGMTTWATTAAWTIADALAERDAPADPQPAPAEPSAPADARRALLGLELPEAFARTRSGGLLHYARGRIALARGDHRLAAAELRRAEPILRALSVAPTQVPWRSQLALALAPDDPEAALALADEELALARAAGYPRPVGVALRAVGVLRADVEALRASLASLYDTHGALDRAYSHVELGAVLRREGDLEAARAQLLAGADLAHRCGAERLLARAREELQAAGARPRRHAITGRDALTPRELHIVRLAAAGRTNGKIAQELFVSLKTVETHLTNAYVKLGLAGRGARSRLADALSE